MIWGLKKQISPLAFSFETDDVGYRESDEGPDSSLMQPIGLHYNIQLSQHKELSGGMLCGCVCEVFLVGDGNLQFLAVCFSSGKLVVPET